MEKCEAISTVLCAALHALQETTNDEKIRFLKNYIPDVTHLLKELPSDIPRKSLLS